MPKIRQRDNQDTVTETGIAWQSAVILTSVQTRHMTRTERAANATAAVTSALLAGNWITEAALIEIATAQLGPRAAFLAQRIVDSVIQTSDGKIGPAFTIRTETYDAEGVDETFAFLYLG